MGGGGGVVVVVVTADHFVFPSSITHTAFLFESEMARSMTFGHKQKFKQDTLV